MTRVFPFLRPPDDTVTVGPWSRLTPDGAEPLPDALLDWDYSTTLLLHRPVTVDGLRLRQLSGLPGGALRARKRPDDRRRQNSATPPRA